MNDFKSQICREQLLELLRSCNCDIVGSEYTKSEQNEEYVGITMANGYKYSICVTADSPMAMAQDVIGYMIYK